MLSRFDTISERDERTDGRADRRTEFLHQCWVSALLCWRAIESASECTGTCNFHDKIFRSFLDRVGLSSMLISPLWILASSV